MSKYNDVKDILKDDNPADLLVDQDDGNGFTKVGRAAWEKIKSAAAKVEDKTDIMKDTKKGIAHRTVVKALEKGSKAAKKIASDAGDLASDVIKAPSRAGRAAGSKAHDVIHGPQGRKTRKKKKD